MSSRFYVLLLILCLFPSDYARAIPPPDLVLSATQALFAAAGLILSSLFLWWVYISEWFKNPHHKKYWVPGVIVLVLACLFLLYKGPFIQQLLWEKRVEQELTEVWALYEKIYSAPSEVNTFISSDISKERGLTWEEFTALAGDDYIVLDIRDHYGYEAGHVPGSIHIRFGDLVRGQWLELLPYKDKHIFVVCYVGVTGSVAINFLRDQGFTNLHRPQGGIIQAVKIRKEIPFTGSLIAPGVQGELHPITDTTAIEANPETFTLIDLRAPSRYSSSTNIGEVSLPITVQHFREFMTTTEIDKFISSLDTTLTYIPYCDSDLSCYQAELLYEDLTRKNIAVPGVYRHETPK